MADPRTRNTDALRYDRTSMTRWQREHVHRKVARGECAEHGCHNPTTAYRCEPCAAAHATKERARKRRRLSLAAIALAGLGHACSAAIPSRPLSPTGVHFVRKNCDQLTRPQSMRTVRR